MILKMTSIEVLIGLLITFIVLISQPDQTDAFSGGRAFSAEARPAAAARGLSETPQNLAVYAGETVVLRCTAFDPQPQSRVMWAEFISLPNGILISDNTLILAHPSRDRYRIIQETSAEFHLEIRDVRLSDGGTYVCQDTLAVPPQVFRGYAELVVIESESACTSTLPLSGWTLDDVPYTYEAECILRYQGAFAPTMTWSGPEPYEVEQSQPNETTVRSSIEFKPNRAMNEEQYECRMYFSDLGIVDGDAANNVPTWEKVYRTPKTEVYWKPNVPTTEPVKPVYEVGDVITCIADSYPASAYMWQNLRTLNFTHDQKYTVTVDMKGRNDALSCRAQAVIHGGVYNNLTVIYARVSGHPENTRAEPLKDAYAVGDVITCTADARPEATYLWQNARTLETFHSRTLSVTESMRGELSLMRCEAKNLIEGVVFSQSILLYVFVPA